MQAVVPVPLYYRSLRHLKNTAFKKAQCFESRVKLIQKARKELHWWIQKVKQWNGKLLTPAIPDLVIETNATRMGCMYERYENRRSVDRGGERAPHQLAGTTRWSLCYEDSGQRQVQCPHKTQDGQHHCNCISEPLGRVEVPKLVLLCLLALAVASAKGNYSLIGAPTGCKGMSGQKGSLEPYTPQLNGCCTQQSANR